MGSDFSNLESNLTESKKKNLLHILLPKPKTLLLSLKIKTQEKAFFSKFICTNQTKTKSKSFFSSHFSFKIAFKPNKSQESQVSSQDHHNQNGENPLKE